MSKISKDGAEQLEVARNALDSMYTKLESAGSLKSVQEEFNFIAELFSSIQSTWGKIGEGTDDSEPSVIINGKIYKSVGG